MCVIETTEQEVTSVLFDYGSPSSSSTTTCSPYLSVTTTVSQPQVAVGDSLRTVELMALDYYRQYVQKVSIKLGIAKGLTFKIKINKSFPLLPSPFYHFIFLLADPIAWSSNDVILWLKYEAEQQGLPPPSFLSSWNMTGLDLCRLTEAQFREMIPHGGELYFAKLEIWREALRTSYQADVSTRHTLSSSMIPHLQYLHPNVTQSPPPMQPLTVHIQPPGPPQHHQMYQSPTSTTSFSPPGMMLSPIPPPLIQMSPSPSPSPRHSQNSNMPSSSSASPPPIQVPTPVIQMEQQQLQGQHEHQNKMKVIPKNIAKLQRFSPTPTASCSKTESPPKQQQPKQYFDSTFVEKYEGDKESTSGTGGNRGGTHIHLWQFLKELLLHPQLYGSCIRWLDRSKGVFKIEDSVRVARLWGKRKNRPAMNYDKLSRSIRQYYKKNIMKKTERSQRLVYQFCHPYGL
ncbi:DNA-binding protein D-ETS-4 [Armadillidium nasatum]|uniref:DNA-binding protein D-ETS-4 n=1 Tax=Armadillidium nasatum TaxID=96803 RepID=A0A5N5SVF2_9CRUS|nr:DNA-binding protein D-ETS-4 [Armadillidium nasatum]